MERNASEELLVAVLRKNLFSCVESAILLTWLYLWNFTPFILVNCCLHLHSVVHRCLSEVEHYLILLYSLPPVLCLRSCARKTETAVILQLCYPGPNCTPSYAIKLSSWYKRENEKSYRRKSIFKGVRWCGNAFILTLSSHLRRGLEISFFPWSSLTKY